MTREGKRTFTSPNKASVYFRVVVFFGGGATDVNSATVIFRQTPDYDSHEGRAGFTGLPSILTAPDKG